MTELIDKEYTSFEEYLAEFYPTTLEEELEQEKDPVEFGRKLAKLSLSRFDQLLENGEATTGAEDAR